MAISTNGGSNPTSVTYNGKNVTEVYYMNASMDSPVKVWPEERFAYLVQNHWPELYSTACLEHNPRWAPAIKTISRTNPNSMYFTSANIPATIPFICTISPVIKAKTYKLDYWTITAPDGTVQKFTDTDPHTIVFDQEGDWVEDSYWINVNEEPNITIIDSPGIKGMYLNVTNTEGETGTFTNHPFNRTKQFNSGFELSISKLEFSSEALLLADGGTTTITYKNKSHSFVAPTKLSVGIWGLKYVIKKDSAGWIFQGYVKNSSTYAYELFGEELITDWPNTLTLSKITLTGITTNPSGFLLNLEED